ncbi:hypothetical protein SUGI_0289840 [Cryptomeria japonica]|uniref:uncharacterized protein LOC131033768 isoform X1 n=1 Tax=Cryptomeria japonica TaxID=3369 RepID=UPI002408AC66|nr:uncharacterized protein LOC131033768 isoform X1 [Cryptomeria japonica]GLJ16822.1 hypothetical protein SUGI_0289840 [Cryptomeria japonica]
MADDPQRIKKIAATAYAYDSDSRWADYWSNILMPPHMASRPDVIKHYKQKFYQRYIDSELEVEPLSSTSSAQTSTRSSAPPPEPNQSANSGSRDQPAGRSAGSSGQASARNNSLRLDRNSIQFLTNAWVVIMAAMAIFPLAPRSLLDRAYRFAILGTGFSCAYSIYSIYGRPRAWSLQAIQIWLQSLIATKDFLYLLYCFSFISSTMPIKFALVPVLCRSLEFVAKYLRRNFSSARLYRKYLENLCLWIDTNSATLNILSSNVEIGLGFLVIILLFTRQRNIVLAFMYWQLLKLMYHAPNTASYHRNVWAKIGMNANPYINRYAPFLQTPISYVQRWLQN